MEVAGVLPPPMNGPGRPAKAARTAAPAQKDEDEELPEVEDADDAPLLMVEDEDELPDDLGGEPHPDRNPPEVDPAV